MLEQALPLSNSPLLTICSRTLRLRAVGTTAHFTVSYLLRILNVLACLLLSWTTEIRLLKEERHEWPAVFNESR